MLLNQGIEIFPPVLREHQANLHLCPGGYSSKKQRVSNIISNRSKKCFHISTSTERPSGGAYVASSISILSLFVYRQCRNQGGGEVGNLLLLIIITVGWKLLLRLYTNIYIWVPTQCS